METEKNICGICCSEENDDHTISSYTTCCKQFIHTSCLDECVKKCANNGCPYCRKVIVGDVYKGGVVPYASEIMRNYRFEFAIPENMGIGSMFRVDSMRIARSSTHDELFTIHMDTTIVDSSASRSDTSQESGVAEPNQADI